MKPPSTFLKIIAITFFGFFQKSLAQPLQGISGMALIDEQATAKEFLYVHDFKLRPGEENYKRFGVLSTSTRWNTKSVDFEDWSALKNIKGSDLESICKIPKTNRFLVAESSYYKGKYGRVIMLEYTKINQKTTVKALAAWKLPNDVQQIEGMICTPLSQEEEGRVLVIIAEREGKTAPKTIRWEVLDVNTNGNTLKFENSMAFQTPEQDGMTRDITDLYLDPSGKLWCTASTDMGDTGPFASAIYAIGQVNKEKCCTVYLYPEPIKKVTLSGLKVEALGAPVLPNTAFTIGSDDEALGSVFRPVGFE